MVGFPAPHWPYPGLIARAPLSILDPKNSPLEAGVIGAVKVKVVALLTPAFSKIFSVHNLPVIVNLWTPVGLALKPVKVGVQLNQ